MSQNCTIFKIRQLFKPFLGNITCLRTLFWANLLISGEIFVLLTCFITKKRLKKQSDFKYCAIMTCSALFRGLISFFYGNITCSRKFLVVCGCNLLISGEIFVLKHVVLPKKDPKSSQILNILQFWPVLLNFDGLFGHFLEI